MRRLLLYFSYIGTNYRGLQTVHRRLTNLNPKASIAPDFQTVQGILEHGLKKILHCNNISIQLSSRTDAGVHAISSTVQFDLTDEIFNRKVPYSPEIICHSLNYYLDKNETDIRVRRIVEVPLDFHCRRATSRIYLYRIALIKSNDFENCPNLLKLSAALPITELYRAQVVPPPFDIHAVQNACRVFLGTWNFRSYMKSGKETKILSLDGEIDEDIFVKTIYKFSFTKVNIKDNSSCGYYDGLDSAYNKLDFYDFTIQGSGFLRRQIRRMVGVLLSIGRGVVDANEILRLLKNPSEKSWNPKISGALSEGLYLKSVNYKNLEILRGPLS